MPRLSLTEWAVLALLVERPAHPFAVARLLGKGGELGQLLTVRRPLVYRAAERLAERGLCRPDHTEPGEGGPERTVYRATPAGRRALAEWLGEPVGRMRDIRPEFLLKVRFTIRAERSPLPLVEDQLTTLRPSLDRLTAAVPDRDEVDLWRRHTALATRAYLEDLIARLRATAPLGATPAGDRPEPPAP